MLPLKLIKSNTWEENTKGRCDTDLRSGKPVHFYFKKRNRYYTYITLSFVTMAGFFIYHHPVLGSLTSLALLPFIAHARSEEIPASELVSVEELRSDATPGGALAGALAGGLVLGSAGVLGGAISGGNQRTSIAILHFTKDRKAIVEGNSRGIGILSVYCIQI
jgi:hypothetical protein